MEVLGLGQLDDGSVEAKQLAKEAAQGSTLEDVQGVGPDPAVLITNTAAEPSVGQDMTAERIQQLLEQTAYNLYEERQKAGVAGSSEQDWEDAKQIVRNSYGVDIA
jgi:hypothetical protein